MNLDPYILIEFVLGMIVGVGAVLLSFDLRRANRPAMGIEHDFPEDDCNNPKVMTNCITWEEWHIEVLANAGDESAMDLHAEWQLAVLRSTAAEYADLRKKPGWVGAKTALRLAGYCIFDGDQQFEILRHKHHLREVA